MSRSRLLLGAVVLGTLALALVLVADSRAYQRDRDERSIELGRRAGIRVARALDAQLSAVSDRALRFAEEIADVQDAHELRRRIQETSLELPLLLGVTVAFEPGRFAGKDRYAPFYNRRRGEFQHVEDTYDYTDRELETARWYTRIVDSGRPAWSEPYYAQAADAMVVDFGVPLVDDQGKPVGVVDYAITLGDFARTVDALSVGDAGYGFTYEPGGAILSHPDPEYLLENVFQLRDGKDEAILAKMRDDREGVVAYHSTYTYRYSWFFFRELDSTGWKSVLVFSEDDLLGASDEGRRKRIHVALGVSAFLLATLFFFALAPPRSRARDWTAAAAASLVLAANIALIWALNLATDFSLLTTDQERLVNPTVVQKAVEAHDQALYKLTQSRYQTVPTGVFIESYELQSFEASVIGRLWMKYPKALAERAPPAFYLPNVSALEPRGLVHERISEVEHEDHILVTWRFRAMLEQDFSYQQFPFEQNDIELLMIYPDPSQNILLVPDLESYPVLNPSARPGLSRDIHVPSSREIASFFTFKKRETRTSFGNGSLTTSPPALSFNLTAKRIFLSPFIANMIPVAIVAIIMFVVLYVSSGRDDDRAGLTSMNVVQSSAGFLFILLLAHVNERGRIETPEIAYIELFYFSMYLLITLQSIALALSIGRSLSGTVPRRNHRALKLAYWPVLLSTWLGMTLVRFY